MSFVNRPCPPFPSFLYSRGPRECLPHLNFSMNKYLEESVANQLLEMLPSRWSALIRRIGKKTQKLQREEHSMQLPSSSASPALRDLEDDFSLADQLLTSEHDIYRDGMSLWHAAQSQQTDGDFPFARSLEIFLRGMLSDLCVKETVLADWRATATSISADTLRVYAHALIAPKEVRKLDAERLVLLAKQTSL